MEDIVYIDAGIAPDIFGQFDAFMKKIERSFGVEVVSRDGKVSVVGGNVSVRHAKASIETLIELRRRGNTITEQNVDYAIAMSMEESQNE